MLVHFFVLLVVLMYDVVAGVVVCGCDGVVVVCVDVVDVGSGVVDGVVVVVCVRGGYGVVVDVGGVYVEVDVGVAYGVVGGVVGVVGIDGVIVGVVVYVVITIMIGVVV